MRKQFKIGDIVGLVGSNYADAIVINVHKDKSSIMEMEKLGLGSLVIDVCYFRGKLKGIIFIKQCGELYKKFKLNGIKK